MTLYLRDGELTGSLFYEGDKGETRIKGFDRLWNNSDKIKGKRSRRFWPMAYDMFDVQMSRDIHNDPANSLVPDGIPEIYVYQFSVLRRYDPRMRCTVQTKEDAAGVTYCLTGQFTKPKGG